MFRHDHAFVWRPVSRFIPINQFAAYAGAWVGVGAGTPTPTEMGTTGLVAPDMADGSEVHHMITWWSEVDPSHRIRFRVLWSSESTTAADTVDWILTYLPIIPGTTQLVDPVTALDTPIPLLAQYGSTSTDVPVWTDYGWINGGTLNEQADMFAFKVEKDANVGLAERTNILGVEISYSPRRLIGPDGMLHEAKVMQALLSKQEVI